MNEKEYYFSAEQISNGIILCLENASKLIEEAEILFNEKRYARTLSLSILSLEELGKINILVEAIHIAKSDKDRIKNFFKEFKSHTVKIKESILPSAGELFFNIMLRSKGNEIEKFPKKIIELLKSFKSRVVKPPDEIKSLLGEKDVEELKLAGFYVDYCEPEFTSPNISKEVALYFLDTSKTMLKEYKEFWGDLEIEKWTKMIKMMRDKKMIKYFLDKFIPFIKSFFKKMGIDIPDDHIEYLKDYMGYKE